MSHPLICSECHNHSELLEQTKALMPDDEKLFELAETFKVFGDSTRIRIMCALMQSEMCVCDISALLQMSQSAISHQLKLLRTHRLVKTRKEGKSVYYSLDDNHVSSILFQGITHIEEERRNAK